ncbi:MAG: nitroreductase family protein [Pseudomonadota bacterium]|nr:nitroreductase family protein [Pseudomonadota bacterium]MED5359704.1 nitroreductase family protein [Pseudomonadota bacterium]
MLDNARFAPSGGNRQGNRVIVVRDQNTKNGLGALNINGAWHYIAQINAVENPWNYTPAVYTPKEIEATKPASLLTETVKNCSGSLVFIVELKVAASMGQDLDCVGIISGGSICPSVWNVLMGAR